MNNLNEDFLDKISLCTALVDHLHAVADAEHGQPQPEYLGVVGGRVVGVHALRAARDDDGGELVVLLDVEIKISIKI